MTQEKSKIEDQLHAESFSNGQINLNIDISHSLLKPNPKPSKLMINTEDEE